MKKGHEETRERVGEEPHSRGEGIVFSSVESILECRTPTADLQRDGDGSLQANALDMAVYSVDARLLGSDLAFAMIFNIFAAL